MYIFTLVSKTIFLDYVLDQLHDIAKILLKVALNTINPNQTRFISPIVVNIQQMGEQKINNF